MDIYRYVERWPRPPVPTRAACSKYGDYLYDDGNYDGAITQYTATIGCAAMQLRREGGGGRGC